MVWVGLGCLLWLLWAGLCWLVLVCYGLCWLALVWYGLCWFGLAWVGLCWFALWWFVLVWVGLCWFHKQCLHQGFLIVSYYMTLQTTTQLQHLNNNSDIPSSQRQLIHINFKTQFDFSISTTTQQMQALQQNTEARTTHIYTHINCRGHIMHMVSI